MQLLNSTKIIASTAGANLLSKGLQFLLVYQAFALVRPYLGVERFGVFSTILSYGAFLGIMDLGIGNVLIGNVARAKASDDLSELAQEIRSGLSVLILLGIAAGAILALIVTFIPATTFFADLPSSAHAEVKAALLIFLLGYACTLPAQGLIRILQGLQRAYWAHGVIALSALISMILLPLAVRSEQTISFLLVLTYLLPAASPLLLLPLVWRYVRNTRWESAALLKRLPGYFHNGGIFFLLQLCALGAWGIDTGLVASNLGSEAAGQYALVQRLFQLITFPLAILSAPLWPIYADAHARGEIARIGKILRNSMAFSAVLSAGAVCIIAFWHREVLSIWLGAAIDVPEILIFTYAAWTIVECVGNSYGMFMNGLNMMKIQLFTNLFFFLLLAFFKITLLNYFGMIALPIGTLLAYFFAIIVPYGIFLRPHRAYLQRAS